MTDTTNIGEFGWKQIPSIFDYLDGTKVDPEDIDRLPTATVAATTRGWREQVDALKKRWRAFVEQLQGYKKEAVLIEHTPVWIPAVDLHVPPAGKAVFTYEQTVNYSAAPDLKVLGLGFGASGVVSFSESIKFSAENTGKSLQLLVQVTISRYIDANGQRLIKLDIENTNERVAHRLVDIPLAYDRRDILANSLQWGVIHQVNLSMSHDKGGYSWQYKAGRQAVWKVGLDSTLLKPMGIDLNISLEVERANTFQVDYEMSYGHDYIFYSRAGEIPLVPFVTMMNGINQ